MQLRGPLSSGWALNSFVHHLEKRKSNCIAVGFFPIGLLPLSNLAMNIGPWGLDFCLCLSGLALFGLKQSSARDRVVDIGIPCAAASFTNCIVTAQDDGALLLSIRCNWLSRNLATCPHTNIPATLSATSCPRGVSRTRPSCSKARPCSASSPSWRRRTPCARRLRASAGRT